jgi:hypothetical protein
MGEDVFDIDRLFGIFDFNYQSIVVTFDVENRAFTYQVTRREITVHFRRVFPSSPPANAIPNPQRGFGVGVLFPKLA